MDFEAASYINDCIISEHLQDHTKIENMKLSNKANIKIKKINERQQELLQNLNKDVNQISFTIFNHFELDISKVFIICNDFNDLKDDELERKLFFKILYLYEVPIFNIDSITNWLSEYSYPIKVTYPNYTIHHLNLTYSSLPFVYLMKKYFSDFLNDDFIFRYTSPDMKKLVDTKSLKSMAKISKYFGRKKELKNSTPLYTNYPIY